MASQDTDVSSTHNPHESAITVGAGASVGDLEGSADGPCEGDVELLPVGATVGVVEGDTVDFVCVDVI